MKIEVCKLSELEPGSAQKLDLQPSIAVIRGENGDVFAIDDTCSHAEASLSEGFVEGDQVECPLHMALFCLKTGAACSAPAKDPVKTHKVIIEGDAIFVEVDR